jgi:hypothetical protein
LYANESSKNDPSIEHLFMNNESFNYYAQTKNLRIGNEKSQIHDEKCGQSYVSNMTGNKRSKNLEPLTTKISRIDNSINGETIQIRKVFDRESVKIKKAILFQNNNNELKIRKKTADKANGYNSSNNEELKIPTVFDRSFSSSKSQHKVAYAKISPLNLSERGTVCKKKYISAESPQDILCSHLNKKRRSRSTSQAVDEIIKTRQSLRSTRSASPRLSIQSDETQVKEQNFESDNTIIIFDENMPAQNESQQIAIDENTIVEIDLLPEELSLKDADVIHSEIEDLKVTALKVELIKETVMSPESNYNQYENNTNNLESELLSINIPGTNIKVQNNSIYGIDLNLNTDVVAQMKDKIEEKMDYFEIQSFSDEKNCDENLAKRDLFVDIKKADICKEETGEELKIEEPAKNPMLNTINIVEGGRQFVKDAKNENSDNKLMEKNSFLSQKKEQNQQSKINPKLTETHNKKTTAIFNSDPIIVSNKNNDSPENKPYTKEIETSNIQIIKSDIHENDGKDTSTEKYGIPEANVCNNENKKYEASNSQSRPSSAFNNKQNEPIKERDSEETIESYQVVKALEKNEESYITKENNSLNSYKEAHVGITIIQTDESKIIFENEVNCITKETITVYDSEASNIHSRRTNALFNEINETLKKKDGPLSVSYEEVNKKESSFVKNLKNGKKKITVNALI